MSRNKFLFALGVCAWLYVGACNADWIVPYNNSPYILKKTKEKVLTYTSGDYASTALYVFPLAYDEAIAGLKVQIEKTFQLASFEPRKIGSFREIDDYGAIVDAPVAYQSGVRQHMDRQLQLSIEMAKSNGISTTGIRYATFVTKDYNLLGSRKAKSVLHVRILDAQDVFKIPGAVMLVYRLDSAKEWGTRNVHDPFSFGYRTRFRRVVTMTEHSILQSWASARGIEYEMRALAAGPVLEYQKEWSEVRNWLQYAPIKR